MLALVRSVAVAAVVNALALGLAAWIFAGFDVRRGWFVVAVVLFTTLFVVLRSTVANSVPRLARGYTVVGGLVLTLAALAITDAAVPSRGFAIDGFWTWVGVTLIVWAASVAYGEIDHQAPAGAPGTTQTR
ncbi:MAG: phage holin family protein [Aeromicrobium erythreum]